MIMYFKIRAPKWLLQKFGITQRQWKSKKRKELKEIVKAFEKYRQGCAYCPDVYNKDIKTLTNVLKSMTESHSVKEWGR